MHVKNVSHNYLFVGRDWAGTVPGRPEVCLGWTIPVFFPIPSISCTFLAV